MELNWCTLGQNWVKLGQMGSHGGTGPAKGAKIGENAAPDVIGLVPYDSKTIRRHSGPLRGEYGPKPVCPEILGQIWVELGSNWLALGQVTSGAPCVKLLPAGRIPMGEGSLPRGTPVENIRNLCAAMFKRF